MFNESVTDHAVSPRGLAETPIDSLIDIVRTDEKSRDCDVVKAELIRREELWASRIDKMSDELLKVRYERLTLRAQLREKKARLEEEKRARRRQEKLLRRGQQQSEMTVRQLYDKAKGMMAESSKWRDLAHRVDVLELRQKILFHGPGVHPELSGDSDGGI